MDAMGTVVIMKKNKCYLLHCAFYIIDTHSRLLPYAIITVYRRLKSHIVSEPILFHSPRDTKDRSPKYLLLDNSFMNEVAIATMSY